MPPTVGILAYGSLTAHPGQEIEEATVITREAITTPFNVEYARSSNRRRGGPTLVPVTDHGAPVQARIFVLDVSLAEATHRLYRREINKVGTERSYRHREIPGLDTVVVRRLESFAELDHVLYTQIAANIDPLSVEELAARAIKSAHGSEDGRDGISYLIDAKSYGIETLLSEAYEVEIKNRTRAGDLHEALHMARLGQLA